MSHNKNPARASSNRATEATDAAAQVFQLITRGALPEAELVAERALKQHPTAELFNAAAVAAIHVNNPRRAEECWLQCIKIAPKQPAGYLNLGKFYFNAKRHRAAEPLLKKALALNPRNPDAMNALGALQQAQGDFRAAHANYANVLKLDPSKTEALNNIGICLTEMGQYAEAEKAFLRLHALPGQKANALARLGLLAEVQGTFDKARECFEASLAIDPGNVVTATQFAALLRKTDALERAIALLQTMQARLPVANSSLLRALAQCWIAAQDFKAARACLQQAHAAAPTDMETLLMQTELAAHEKDFVMLDALLAQIPLHIADPETAAVEAARLELLAGRPLAALASVQSAQRALGKATSLLCLEGDAQIALHNPVRAEAAFRAALLLEAPSVKARLGLGFALGQRSAHTDALAHYEQSLRLHPGNALLRAGLAQTLIHLGKFDQAGEILEPLYLANPQNSIIATTYSHYARLTGKLTEALKAALTATRHAPHERAANTALIAAYEEIGDLEHATRRAREIVARDPNDSDTTLRLAMLLLAQGQFDEGWAAYEARLVSMLDTDHPYTRAPRWQGEALHGKTLLVAHEQGMGDELQFYRYLPAVQERLGGQVLLVCKPPLHSLFAAQETFPVYSFDTPRAADLPDHDYWVPLMSLPHLARSVIPSIPEASPYLQVPDHKRSAWRDRLAHRADPELRIGIIWKGNPNHQNDSRRSLPSLDVLAPLFALKKARFLSLQKDIGPAEFAPYSTRYGIESVASELADVMDAAAIMTQLDLVITIDSMPAHLAGALGIPCWIMLPACAEWRWMTGRNDTPWYPRTRLYRQETPGDWKGIAVRIAEDLERPSSSMHMTHPRSSIYRSIAHPAYPCRNSNLN